MSPHWRAAAEAGLLIAGAGLIVAADAPAASPAFRPPCNTPMLLSRTVTRELAGGYAIVATRRYRIAFHRIEGGWRIDGALVASEIDAPPALAPLVAIERDRPDDGLFPILLDESGRIVPSERPAATATVEQAIAAAAGVAKAVGAVPDPAFLAQLRSAGGLTPWPETLFLPVTARSESAREVELPDGAGGTVKVELDTTAAEDAPLMARAERIVTTEMGGRRKVAREAWTLQAEATSALR